MKISKASKFLILLSLLLSISHAWCDELKKQCIEDGGDLICAGPDVGIWKYGAIMGNETFSGWNLASEDEARKYLTDNYSVNPSCQTPEDLKVGNYEPISLSSGTAIVKKLQAYPRLDALVTWNIIRKKLPNCPSYIYGDPGIVVSGYIGKIRDISCPIGYSADDTNNYCYAIKVDCNCGPKIGNPIQVSNGAKQQVETDIDDLSGTEIKFYRTYNSMSFYRPIGEQNHYIGSMGNYWHHTFEKLLFVQDLSSLVMAILRDSDGSLHYYDQSGAEIHSSIPNNDRLVSSHDNSGNKVGWELHIQNGMIEFYDLSGMLSAKKYLNGNFENIVYDNFRRIDYIANSFGKKIVFFYDEYNRISKIVDAAGKIYTYNYDEIDNLISIEYPDENYRKYFYENSTIPHALTGMQDENGHRLSTYTYQNDGKALSTEHAGSTNKFSIDYPFEYIQRNTIDPLGTKRSISFSIINGVLRTVGQSFPDSQSNSNIINYDSQGNVSSSTDFNGVTTTYTYDLTRNLETSRVEASGTPKARTTTTTWHSTYRLPLQIAEPKRITTFVYDANGNLLSKSVQATTDTTGASGLSATTTGPIRTWSYTYTSLGQMLTATGPTKDLTSYSYDEHGNLTSVTNAAGHVTNLSNYDGNGRVGRITDPNGLITDLTYTPRGWLLSRTVGGQVTNFGYDGVGQLTQVTFPDTSTINYVYDDSHRLTSVADSLGNSIAYTLDNMGNRTGETVVDPTEALARQTNRVYDALNRLQQQTGGVQ